ncbi:c-type cytochrome [Blastochloris tepida]|jgi:sulfide dehydrogenase cytochrome subunit|uniref:Cytochrome subunit of sulfide dehydrogenase n=1 Tax=Blastochloris tepida TaxID=2233851 RepID=A0A348FXY8_9HYPH|nr:c-type cytochrome [Blastochloris tepida]BBF92171.1 cytochrome subunit of sulfide dehydrogenase [Blastochloris tepida]
MFHRPLLALLTAGALALTAGAAFADTKPAKRTQAAPPLIAQACAGCHGQKGQGQNGTPVLAAYNKDNFIRVWGEFRNGQRPAATIMPRIARGYSDEEVTVLADYFASIPR